MYIIKELKISINNKVIRTATFTNAANLIVDETPMPDGVPTKSGNNIGKTTFLRIIDFMLGGNRKKLFTRPTDVSEEYLTKNLGTFSMTLQDTATKNRVNVVRGFNSKGHVFSQINGKNVSNQTKYLNYLANLFFTDEITSDSSPSYRELIDRVVRYSSRAVENTFKYLQGTPTGRRYESIYLYMFQIDPAISTEDIKSLEDTKSTYNQFLDQLTTNIDIHQLEAEKAIRETIVQKLDQRRKDLLEIPNYQIILDELIADKKKITKINQQLADVRIKRDILREQKEKLNLDDNIVDDTELQSMYADANELLGTLPKDFHEVVQFVRTMKMNRYNFAKKNLSDVLLMIKYLENRRDKILTRISKNEHILLRGDVGEVTDIQKLISEYTLQVDKLGRLTEQINQIKQAQYKLDQSTQKLESKSLQSYTAEYLNKFNGVLQKFSTSYLTPVFQYLYGNNESAYIYAEEGKSAQGSPFYKLKISNTLEANSSGSKQALTIAFDIAYLEYARSSGIATPGFVISDRKELVDNRQLIRLIEYANKKHIQVIFPILQDKLSDENLKNTNVLIRLSQDDKLYRIESSNSNN